MTKFWRGWLDFLPTKLSPDTFHQPTKNCPRFFLIPDQNLFHAFLFPDKNFFGSSDKAFIQERLYLYRNLWSGKSDQNILGWLNFSATKIFPDKVYYFRVERLLNSFGFYTLSLLFCRLNGMRIVNCFVWRFQWTFIRHKRRTAFKMVSWKDRHTSTRHGIGLNMRWELLLFFCFWIHVVWFRRFGSYKSSSSEEKSRGVKEHIKGILP